MNTKLLERIFRPLRAFVPFMLGAVVGGVFVAQQNPAIYRANAATMPDAQVQKRGAKLAALQAEVNRLKDISADQSTVMASVAYHYANLWFAAQNENWPLAEFYFDEARSDLHWAVRIIPVRETSAGDVDLKAILQAVDTSLLSEVGKAIDGKDREKFALSYRQSLEGCYACHKASEKPYLRPQIPERPAVPIINFNPDATWPQ